MDVKLPFQPRARLLLQLGDQLIRSESIALLEIIKNSYDANASTVNVSMKNIDKPDKGRIVIEDDGAGMDSDIIKNVWMQPGSDYKLKIIQSLKNPHDVDRVPIGEKGIGRFGVHKLGYRIELVSKKAGKKEICLKIDWRDFEKDDLLDNVKITLKQRDIPLHFTGKRTGTRILIEELKSAWTKATIRELYRAVNSLSSPFDSLDSFKVYFSIDKQEWLSGLMSFKDIEDYALYFADAVIENNRIKRLKYEFRPWDTMNKLGERKEDIKDIRLTEEIYDDKTNNKNLVNINLNDFKIGRIHFKLLIFDRASKVLSLGVTDKKGFKEYLDVNGGVRVYRDGIRVYDYGEPLNDWLNLDIRRVNQPGKTISNNIIIGAINLDRIASSDLIEKTNREGFVENEAYFKFLSAIQFTLDKILSQRNIDKDKVRKIFSPSAHNEPVIGNLKILQEKITNKISDIKFRDELIKTIRDIEEDYKTINEIYTRSSSAGLSLGIVIHEVSKIIDELLLATEEIPSQRHIVSLVKILHKTVNDYATVIKQSSKSNANIVEIIDQALSNIQFRIRAHKLEIIRNYQNHSKLNTLVKCAPNLIISTIINLIDNSIWWQNYGNIKNKKIIMDILEEPEGYLSVLIADNGPGFTIPPEEAIKPFISDKPGGMGLGLHLASEVMNGQKGQLIFPEAGDYNLPNEFNNGATILLAFKR
jgi:signal transduction histidine kinase